jgi:thymidylate synthase
MNFADSMYQGLCRRILTEGVEQPNRTGVSSISIFGHQCTYNLMDGFPLLTTKKINFEAVVAELLWFLSGSTNINDLPKAYQFIWKPWAKDNGEVGPIYGSQWTNWNGHLNQLKEVIARLRSNPYDRRLVVSAWNADRLDDMALPPCHVMFQLKAYPPFLDLQMYQRSCDVPVGVPFNIASYALLLSMIAQEVGLVPRYFIHTLGDAHIYVDQVDGIREQLMRSPKELPTLVLPPKSLFEMTLEEIYVEGYDPHPFIRFPVAV